MDGRGLPAPDCAGRSERGRRGAAAGGLPDGELADKSTCCQRAAGRLAGVHEN